MLTKNNKILVGCLALLLVMSVGYALFSDTITVTGTATAKGNFDMSAVCQSTTENGGTGSCSVEGNNIITNSSLSKPGDNVVFTVRITNSGSIPAKLISLMTPNNSTGAADYVNGEFKVREGEVAYIDTENLLAATYKLKLGENEISGDSNILAAASKIAIEPGMYFDIEIRHFWLDVDSSVQPELPENGATITYNMEMGYQQITN